MNMDDKRTGAPTACADYGCQEEEIEIVEELVFAPAGGKDAESIESGEHSLHGLGHEDKVDEDFPEETVGWETYVVVVWET